jgi:hypothetical protein
LRTAVCTGNEGLLYKISSGIKFRIILTDCRNNRKAPACRLTPQGREADRYGHPGRVKVRRGGSRAEEWNGGCFICLFISNLILIVHTLMNV